MIDLIPKQKLFSTFKRDYIQANSSHNYVMLDKLFEDIYNSGYEFNFNELEIGLNEYFIGNIMYWKSIEQFEYFLRNFQFTDTKQYNFTLWCLLDNYTNRIPKIELFLKFRNEFKIDESNRRKLLELNIKYD